MITKWYLVKQNWPDYRLKTYAGVGGDIWPLDTSTFQAAKTVHSRFLKSRDYLKVDEYEELLCTDLKLAKDYFSAVYSNLGEAWLLEAMLANVEASDIAGIDLGFPSGGFSVIETELITQSLPGPKLNKWGLIERYSDALYYLEFREENEELEHIDKILPISIKILGHQVT